MKITQSNHPPFFSGQNRPAERESRAEKPPIIYDTCEAAEIACCRKIWHPLQSRRGRQNTKIREKFVPLGGRGERDDLARAA